MRDSVTVRHLFVFCGFGSAVHRGSSSGNETNKKRHLPFRLNFPFRHIASLSHVGMSGLGVGITKVDFHQIVPFKHRLNHYYVLYFKRTHKKFPLILEVYLEA